MLTLFIYAGWQLRAGQAVFQPVLAFDEVLSIPWSRIQQSRTRTASCSQVFYAKAKTELQQNTGPLDTSLSPRRAIFGTSLHETFDPESACPTRKDSQGQLRVAALKSPRACRRSNPITAARRAHRGAQPEVEYQKRVIRQKTCLIAVGMNLRRLAVSAAARPMNSVPAKATLQ